MLLFIGILLYTAIGLAIGTTLLASEIFDDLEPAAIAAMIWPVAGLWVLTVWSIEALVKVVQGWQNAKPRNAKDF